MVFGLEQEDGSFDYSHVAGTSIVLVLNVIRCSCHYHHDSCDYHWDFYGQLLPFDLHFGLSLHK